MLRLGSSTGGAPGEDGLAPSMSPARERGKATLMLLPLEIRDLIYRYLVDDYFSQEWGRWKYWPLLYVCRQMFSEFWWRFFEERWFLILASPQPLRISIPEGAFGSIRQLKVDVDLYHDYDPEGVVEAAERAAGGLHEVLSRFRRLRHVLVQVTVDGSRKVEEGAETKALKVLRRLAAELDWQGAGGFAAGSVHYERRMLILHWRDGVWLAETQEEAEDLKLCGCCRPLVFERGALAI